MEKIVLNKDIKQYQPTQTRMDQSYKVQMRLSHYSKFQCLFIISIDTVGINNEIYTILLNLSVVKS